MGPLDIGRSFNRAVFQLCSYDNLDVGWARGMALKDVCLLLGADLRVGLQ